MKKLIFVYNANSGTLNTLLDIGHKLLSPSTYNCQLCSLTHGALAEKKQWKEFRESFPHDLIFLHKDEFEEEYQQSFIYPVVLEDVEGEIKERIAYTTFADLNELEELISLLECIVVS